MAELNPATLAARYIARDFYAYATDHIGVVAGANSSQSITIEADSDFQLEKLTFACEVAGANELNPLLKVLIQDTGSGRYIMAQAIAVPALFGNGQLPFVLVQPKIFLSRTTISVTVSNYSAATTYDAHLNFIGSKLFRANA